MINLDHKFESLKPFLDSAGVKYTNYQILNSGANSFSYRILTKEKDYFLKTYINNIDNPRDRLACELQFLKLLNKSNISNVPTIISSSTKHNSILMNWISGEMILDPKESDWKKYFNFLINIQSHADLDIIENFHKASEAAFSLNKHFEIVLSRLEKLITYTAKTDSLKQVNLWVEKYLYNRLIDLITSNNLPKLIMEEDIPLSDRILSPSDVGFHNVLKANDNLFFIDFEYSGVDDPYKLLSDILIHPNNNFSADFILLTLSNLKYIFNNRNLSISKLLIMLEIYIIKWCVIMLRPIFKKSVQFSEKQVESLIYKVNSYYHLKTNQLNGYKAEKLIFSNNY